MAKTKTVTIAIIALLVLASAGIGSYTLMNKSTDDDKVIETGRLVIYGNANNDDYLDDRDVQFIQNILDGAVWDESKYPFADTDTNGKIEQNDIDLLKKFINKESAKMFYYGSTGKVLSISYPITGNLAVNFSYGLDVAIILGCYDRVTVVDNQTKGTDNKYPGLSEKTNVGDPRDDAEAMINEVKNNNVKAVFGYDGSRISKIVSNVENGGAHIDGIQLTFNHITGKGCDKYGSILTLGIMLGCEEQAYKFVKYVDKIIDYLVDKNPTQKTYVMPEYEEEAYGSATSTWIMTTNRDSTWTSGANNTVEYLNLKDVYANQFSDGFIEIPLEDIETKNPDVILLCSWGVVTEDMTEAEMKEALKGFFKQYEGCAAYEKGNVYVITYEAYGTIGGIAGTVLLGSYIWPELYDEEKGWKLLQEYYDDYTLMDVNVKELPTLSPFKLSDSN